MHNNITIIMKAIAYGIFFLFIGVYLLSEVLAEPRPAELLLFVCYT